MFNYNVMSEEDAEKLRFQLLPDGEYIARVYSCVAKQSKTGNFMLELEVHVEGQSLKDWLVFSDAAMWKVISFCKSAGLEQAFVDKALTEQLLVGKEVKVLIKTEEGQ